jgi:hypothetical protein
VNAKTCSGLETTPNDHDLRLEYEEFTWRPRDNDEAGSVFDEPYERYLDSEDVVVPPLPLNPCPDRRAAGPGGMLVGTTIVDSTATPVTRTAPSQGFRT